MLLASKAMVDLLIDEFGWDVLALEAHFAGLAASTVPVLTEVAILGSAVLPVLAFEGVCATLGAGYFQARNLVRNENTKSGFSEGYVMGLLNWPWSNVRSLFGRYGVIKIYATDEQLDVIRVNAYNSGLVAGYKYGSRFPEAAQKAIIARLRQLAGHPSSGRWTRRDQISFVIALATALRTKFLWK